MGAILFLLAAAVAALAGFRWVALGLVLFTVLMLLVAAIPNSGSTKRRPPGSLKRWG